MPIKFPTSIAILFVYLTLAVPPPITPSNPLFLLPESDQKCNVVGCPNPYQEGARFCRSLNTGCIFCAPHPRSMAPLVTFACVGQWTRPLVVEQGNGTANRSRDVSTLLDILSKEEG